MPPLARTRSAGVRANTSFQVPAAAHTSSKASRSSSTNTRSARGVAERAARRRSGSRWRSRTTSASTRPALRPAGGRRQLLLVELVRPADVGHDDLAVHGEDQRLHDLPHVDADGRGGVGGRLGAFRERADLDVEPEVAGGVGDAVGRWGASARTVGHESRTCRSNGFRGRRRARRSTTTRRSSRYRTTGRRRQARRTGRRAGRPAGRFRTARHPGRVGGSSISTPRAAVGALAGSGTPGGRSLRPQLSMSAAAVPRRARGRMNVDHSGCLLTTACRG